MKREYLQAEPRERIRDLMSERGMTISRLAEIIGCDETTLGRYLRGRTQKISDEQLIAIAKEFGVSLDFLLCETDIPDKLNFELADLGLSVKAAQNLYTGKTDPRVVSLLLENERFAALTTMLAHYFDGTFSAGFAAQNQMYRMLSSMVLKTGEAGAQKAAEAAALQGTHKNRGELAAIEELFSGIVREIKKQQEPENTDSTELTREIMAELRQRLLKGRGPAELSKVSMEEIIAAVADITAASGNLTEEQRSKIIEGITPMFEALSTGDNSHEAPNQ